MPDTPKQQYQDHLVAITGKEFSGEANDSYHAWADARVGRFDTSWDQDGLKLRAQSEEFAEVLAGEGEEIRAADFQRFQDVMQLKSGYRTPFCFVDGVELMGPMAGTA